MARPFQGSVQVKVLLRDIRPPVWRRLVVPATLTLAAFHDVIQLAMGWYDCHLHAFEIEGVRYGVPDGEDWGTGIGKVDELAVVLRDVVRDGQKFRYEYDFGDGWEHDITVEKLLPGEETWRCLTGRRACPPEDVGGPRGYETFLAAITDPKHAMHAEYTQWLDRPFDPEALDIEGINDALAATEDMRVTEDLVIVPMTKGTSRL